MYGAPLDVRGVGLGYGSTLVAYAGKSAVLQQGSRTLAQLLSDAELRQLKGVGHNVKMEAPAPAEFLAVAVQSANRKDFE